MSFSKEISFMRKLIGPMMCTAILAGAAILGSACSFTVQGSTDTPPPKQTQAAATTPPPPPPAPKKVRVPHKVTLHGNKIDLPGPVMFDTGTANLRPESDTVLEVVEDYMNQEKTVNILRIEGHTDSDGEAEANYDLSQRRAMAVANWLVTKGIDCKRLLPVGFGESTPIADNKTEEGKAQNRRVDFVKASENGKPVTDDKGKPLPVDGGPNGRSAGNPCK
jgi:OOP family OmpA-OmpF porin